MPKKFETKVDSVYAWITALASLLLATIGAGIFYLVGIAIVPYAQEWSISVEEASRPYGAAMLGMGFGGLLMGWLADRYGAFFPTFVGAISIGAGCFLVSLSDNFSEVLLIYAILLGGFGNSALAAPLFANAMLWFKKRRGVASAIVGSGNALGGAVWPTVYFWYVSNFGIESLYQSFALFATVTMVPLCFILRIKVPPPQESESNLQSNGLKDDNLIFGQKIFVALTCLAIVGCCISMSMPLVHLPNYVGTKDISLEQGAILLSVLMTSSVSARMLWGLICDKIGGLLTLLMASSLQALGITGMAFANELPTFYLSGIIFGIGFGGILPCYPVILRELLPSKGLALRIGLVVLFGTVGMALGPEIAGNIFARTESYRVGFLAGVTANIVNMVIISIIIIFGVRSVKNNSATT